MKAVVFNDNGEILTLFRTETAPARPNTWDLPGGDLDFGEDPGQAIVREVKEETGLDVKDVQIFDAIGFISDFDKITWVTLAYKCKVTGTGVKISWEHNDYRWVTPEEFIKLKSSDRLQRFVRNSV